MPFKIDLNKNISIIGLYTSEYSSSYQVSPLGSDLTFCRLSVAPLPKEELMRLNRLQKNGLDELVKYEEDKILEKKRKKQEKEDKMKDIKERNKKFA